MPAPPLTTGRMEPARCSSTWLGSGVGGGLAGGGDERHRPAVHNAAPLTLEMTGCVPLLVVLDIGGKCSTAKSFCSTSGIRNRQSEAGPIGRHRDAEKASDAKRRRIQSAALRGGVEIVVACWTYAFAASAGEFHAGVEHCLAAEAEVYLSFNAVLPHVHRAAAPRDQARRGRRRSSHCGCAR